MKTESKKIDGGLTPQEQPYSMSIEEIARNIAVLVVRQHRRVVVEDAKKSE